MDIESEPKVPLENINPSNAPLPTAFDNYEDLNVYETSDAEDV